MMRAAIFVLVAYSINIVPSIVADSPDETCTLDSGIKGKCVRYYLCDYNKTVVTDGRNLYDTRKRRSADEQCSSYLDTCCMLPNDLPEDMPTTPTPSTSDKFLPTETDRNGCGWRNPTGVGLNLDGLTGKGDNEAKFGEFPWMVAVLKSIEEDSLKLNMYVGGGSLIHPNVVLTAAHYVADHSQLLVRVGEWDVQTRKEIYPHQDRDVKEVVIHKDFDKGNSFYDVALLFLAEPVNMSAPHIGLACLPPQGRRATPGTRCQAAGWGKDQFGKEGRYSVLLKNIEVPVVDRSVCQTQLRKTRLGPYFQLHSSFMCAGGEDGKDACKGDGGSPLVCPLLNQKDRYIQNGIVAWGVGCGNKDIPGVYVDVANLRSWIDDKVAGHGYDPKTYTY